MNNKITITKEEWDLYLLFKQNQTRFKVLSEAGVFNLKEGKAEINCHTGEIQTIVIHRRTYKRAVGNGKILI